MHYKHLYATCLCNIGLHYPSGDVSETWILIVHPPTRHQLKIYQGNSSQVFYVATPRYRADGVLYCKGFRWELQNREERQCSCVDLIVYALIEHSGHSMPYWTNYIRLFKMIGLKVISIS